jgi:hypothetical protein
MRFNAFSPMQPVRLAQALTPDQAANANNKRMLKQMVPNSGESFVDKLGLIIVHNTGQLYVVQALNEKDRKKVDFQATVDYSGTPVGTEQLPKDKVSPFIKDLDTYINAIFIDHTAAVLERSQKSRPNA